MSRAISGMSDDTFRKLSSLYDQLDYLNIALRTCHRNRYRLEEEKVKYGPKDVPISVYNDIEETQSQIEKLQDKIKGVEDSISELKKMILGEARLSQEEEKTLFSRFWRLSAGESLFCAVSTLEYKYTGWYNRPMAGFGEIQGYASIVYSLTRAYETTVMRDAGLFSDNFPFNIQLGNSLVLLGGDDKNKVTADMIKEFQRIGCKLPFRFKYEETENREETGVKYLICEDEEGNEKKYEPIKRDRIEDFGIVARLPNPFDRHHSRLFIFAGCHSYGTAAAARVVATRSILERIEKACQHYREGKFFVAVIHANVIGYTFFQVDRMEIFYPLAEETFKPIPKGIVRDVRF